MHVITHVGLWDTGKVVSPKRNSTRAPPQPPPSRIPQNPTGKTLFFLLTFGYVCLYPIRATKQDLENSKVQRGSQSTQIFNFDLQDIDGEPILPMPEELVLDEADLMRRRPRILNDDVTAALSDDASLQFRSPFHDIEHRKMHSYPTYSDSDASTRKPRHIRTKKDPAITYYKAARRAALQRQHSGQETPLSSNTPINSAYEASLYRTTSDEAQDGVHRREGIPCATDIPQRETPVSPSRPFETFGLLTTNKPESGPSSSLGADGNVPIHRGFGVAEEPSDDSLQHPPEPPHAPTKNHSSVRLYVALIVSVLILVLVLVVGCRMYYYFQFSRQRGRRTWTGSSSSNNQRGSSKNPQNSPMRGYSQGTCQTPFLCMEEELTASHGPTEPLTRDQLVKGQQSRGFSQKNVSIELGTDRLSGVLSSADCGSDGPYFFCELDDSETTVSSESNRHLVESPQKLPISLFSPKKEFTRSHPQMTSTRPIIAHHSGRSEPLSQSHSSIVAPGVTRATLRTSPRVNGGGSAAHPISSKFQNAGSPRGGVPTSQPVSRMARDMHSCRTELHVSPPSKGTQMVKGSTNLV